MRPNVPAIARIEAQARRELAGAYAQIENLDWNVGRVRQALAQAGLDEDTHIIFFSDHGDMHGSHGQLKKTSPWEEAMRVPFIVSGLQGMYAARTGRTPALINHVDIAPTTLGLCGIDKPDWMRGADLSGLRLPGRPAPSQPDSAYLQCVIPTLHADSIDRPWRGLVTADGWKYVALEGQPWLLFNLNEDPYELANHAHNTRYQSERKRLNERLRQWVADTGDTFQLPEF
jgi:arylsulfatase A-like enzyme